MKARLIVLALCLHVFGDLVTAKAVEIEDRLMTTGFKPGRDASTVIDTVVIHSSSNVVKDRQNPYDVDAVIKIFVDNKVSAHYLIDRSGKIYRLVEENDTSFHSCPTGLVGE